MAFLESLPDEQQAEWRMAVRFLVLLIRHKRAEYEQPMLYNVIDELVAERHRLEVDEMVTTIAEADIAKGMIEGLNRGRL